jgi:NAD(P)-dependent dehydrogenase (short-subunit alcohol dehydrogenase family)
MDEMRIIVIGATGTIGKAVVGALSGRHEVVQVGHRGGEYQVDLAAKDSIERLFEMAAPFDAVVCAAGLAKFGALEGLSDADFQFSLGSKLMGQVNVVRAGMGTIREGGSFTLTSGVLATEPTHGSAAISLAACGSTSSAPPGSARRWWPWGATATPGCRPRRWPAPTSRASRGARTAKCWTRGRTLTRRNGCRMDEELGGPKG